MPATTDSELGKAVREHREIIDARKAELHHITNVIDLPGQVFICPCYEDTQPHRRRLGWLHAGSSDRLLLIDGPSSVEQVVAHLRAHAAALSAAADRVAQEGDDREAIQVIADRLRPAVQP